MGGSRPGASALFGPRRLKPEEMRPGTGIRAVQWDARGEIRLWTEDGYLPERTPSDSEDPETLAYVRFVRDDCPEHLQHDWPAYCLAVALPLVRSERPDRPLRPFERRSDLPWYDPLYGGLILALQVVGLIHLAITGLAGLAIFATVLAGAYALLRVWHLRRRRPRILVLHHGDDVWREVRRAGGHFLLCGAGLAAMIWLGNGGWPVWLWGPVGAVPVVGSCFALDASRKRIVQNDQRRLEEDAVAEWDALHADPQREPAWQTALWEAADAHG